MDIEQEFTVSRHMQWVDFKGQKCLKSGSTVITIPALIELVHNELNRQGYGVPLNLDGLFLAAADALQTPRGHVRFVDLKEELKEDYEILNVHRYLEQSYAITVRCPFFADITIYGQRGFCCQIVGKFS